MPSKGYSKLVILGLLVLVIAGIAISVKSIFFLSGHSSSDDTTREEREQLYTEATERAATNSDYPSTEQELIKQFWQSIVDADWKTTTMLCPGSQQKDFAMYEKWKPGPIKSVGVAEPHQKAPGVQMWPISTSFPGFPEKTIKLAVRKTEDGRLIIDGSHTIWW